MTDYGNPRLRANTDNESAYVNALMSVGHEALTEAFASYRGGEMELTVDVRPTDYDVSQVRGSSAQEGHMYDHFWTRVDDLTGVVFDSLFSRFRAQAIYGQLSVDFTGATGALQMRDTY